MLSLLRVAALTLLPTALAQDTAAQDAPAAAQETRVFRELEITFLANEGFLIRTGPYKILIDGFLKDPYNVYEALPPATFRKLAEAEAPFDGHMFALVSHVHQDHFQPRPAELWLRNNPDSMLVSSPQVIHALVTKSESLEDVKERFGPLALEVGESETFVTEVPEELKDGTDWPRMSIEFMRLPHVGDFKRIQNYAHLISVGGFKILHVGDADPSVRAFDPFHLAQKDIDIAFVPYWYFSNEEGVKVVDDHMSADWLIAAHIPPKQRKKILETMKEANPHVIVFEESGDLKIFRDTTTGVVHED